MKFFNKQKESKKNSDPIVRLLAPMIIGTLVCVICLASMTWAWFTASVDVKEQTIQAADRSTLVMVYEVAVTEDENQNPVETKTLVKPKEVPKKKDVTETEEKPVEGDNTEVTDQSAVWELLPEKTYEVILTGGGTATSGYCQVALSHAVNGSEESETKVYTTTVFEKDNSIKFTYNTGGFADAEGVTETEYKKYVEKTIPPTIAIASHWGKPAEDDEIVLLSLNDKSKEKLILSDGDVVGLAPIPCPEAKAESEFELEGFEISEGEVISAETDYQISLALKEGYEMPSEVVVNIAGKEYVVSTGGAEATQEAPYFDITTGILTVPSALLSDGVKVSVKGNATPAPVVEEEEEEPEEEEETEEEIPVTEEIVADDPSKKEDDETEDGRQSYRPVIGGGNDDDDDDEGEEDESSDGSQPKDDSSTVSGGGTVEEEEEKADVKLNLSQLIINLEETRIPTNADLVFTLVALENMELPEQVSIVLDKTIRFDEVTEEEIPEEEIVEDKEEFVINTDGEDNPEGFEFDIETGKLTISSELLKGVREITIADVKEDESEDKTEDEEKTTISFEVKNLTFDFDDEEIVTDEDVVITFTAGEEYELPETITITIDGVEYVVYTSEEDSDKNPEGITFDPETGMLTVSKDLLENAKEIVITAEGVKKEDEKPEGEESTDDEPESGSGDPGDDKDVNNKEEDENPEGGESTEGGTEAPGTGGGATGGTPEGGTENPEVGDDTNDKEDDDEGGESTEGGSEGGTEDPEIGGGATEGNPEGGTENPEVGGDITDKEEGTEGGESTDGEPENGDSTDTNIPESGSGNGDDGEDDGETEGEGTTPADPTPEGGNDEGSESTTPTEPTTPVEPSEPTVTPDASGSGENNTNDSESSGESNGDSGEAGNTSDNTDSGSAEGADNNAGTEGSAPNTDAPASSEPSTSDAPAASAESSNSGETSQAILANNGTDGISVTITDATVQIKIK